MDRYPQSGADANAKPTRQEFADGSAVVTYPDGSMLILESELAREGVFMGGRPVNYNQPPPPAGPAKKRERENYLRMLKARSPDSWRKLPPMVSVPSVARPK